MATRDDADEPATSGSGRKNAREPVALALAAGRTVKDAAAEGRVSERTVRNWRAEASFVARVAELRAEMFALAVGKLADLSGRAVDVLGQLLGSESENVRRQAANDVLTLGPRLRESQELAAKVAELATVLAGMRK